MNGTRKLLDGWLPPEGAGRPVACVATSYTFDPAFFEGDCLARFLGLDTARGEGNDLAFLIEQEEALAEVRVTVIVDRSYSAEGRSLRWDILPVGLRGGVQHAKVALLAWDEAVRFIVGSANLRPPAYRGQVETALVLDAFDGSRVPRHLFAELVTALRMLVRSASSDPARPGPAQRVSEVLDQVDEQIDGFVLPAGGGRDGLRAELAIAAPGRPVLPQLRKVWRGGPPRTARVLSPFFDSRDSVDRATVALVGELAQRGACQLEVLVPVDTIDGRTLVRAPKSILAAAPSRLEVAFYQFDLGEADARRLHAKALLIESDNWTSLLVGSSNFTGAGLGLLPSGGNLEINLAFGAPARSAEAKEFRKLFAAGEQLDPSEDEWEPETDQEERVGAELPWTFGECLLDPAPSAVIIRFAPGEMLPQKWTISLPEPEGRLLVGDTDWQRKRNPTELRFSLEPDEHPFFLVVAWTDAEGVWKRTDWPLNVTEPSRLPPPEELRDLPVEALMQALASTRPLHESLAMEIERLNSHSLIDLIDPLQRYSSSSYLFQRTRRLSAALEGLRRRLERPCSNNDVLIWRLRGPFGPVALAEGLIRELDGGLSGEASFLIGEIALTLSRVDWVGTATGVPYDVVKQNVNEVLKELRAQARTLPTDERLAQYVNQALRAAHL